MEISEIKKYGTEIKVYRNIILIDPEDDRIYLVADKLLDFYKITPEALYYSKGCLVLFMPKTIDIEMDSWSCEWK